MGNKAELRRNIEDWLVKQGYPLEMEAAKVFQSVGFEARQSVYYEDAESGVSRETDVVASQDANVAGVLIRLSVVIECKLADDKPWILFSTGGDELPGRTSVAQRAASLAGAKALLSLMKCPETPGLPLFTMGANTGYGIIQALGKDNNDHAYKALMSVTSAAWSMALHSDVYSPQDKRVVGIKQHYAHMLFPVVVIDSSLWRCCLTSGSPGVNVSELESGVLVWKKPVFRHPHTVVHVVTKRHLKTFAEGAARTWSRLREIGEGAAKHDIASIPAAFAERRKSRKVTSIAL